MWRLPLNAALRGKRTRKQALQHVHAPHICMHARQTTSRTYARARTHAHAHSFKLPVMAPEHGAALLEASIAGAMDDYRAFLAEP